VRHVFLLAGQLKQSLNEAARQGRGYFLTVARLDGKFGLGNTSDSSAVSGGLFGLTKTLNLEWQSVFCRAIDLDSALDASHAVQHIVAELHDPNCLITEVGYGAHGRTTLVNM
jgi:hypothetical protein